MSLRHFVNVFNNSCSIEFNNEYRYYYYIYNSYYKGIAAIEPRVFKLSHLNLNLATTDPAIIDPSYFSS